MRQIKKILLIFSLVIVILVILFFLSGYHFTAKKALKIKNKEDIILYNSENDWINIYLIETKLDFKTYIVTKKYLLWKKEVTTSILKKAIKDDAIRTIGLTSYKANNGDQVIFLAIQSEDPNIDHIVAGTKYNTQSKTVKDNNIVIFTWYTELQLNELFATAYNKKNEAIYNYQFNPKNIEYSKPNELKWYYID